MQEVVRSSAREDVGKMTEQNGKTRARKSTKSFLTIPVLFSKIMSKRLLSNGFPGCEK